MKPDKKAEKALMAAIQGDREEVLKEQVGSIEEEIGERKELEEKSEENIGEEVSEVKQEILKLKTPEDLPVPDPAEWRRDRIKLENQKLGLTHEMRQEKRDCWKDVQGLKEEEREAEKEISSLEKRKKRIGDIL